MQGFAVNEARAQTRKPHREQGRKARLEGQIIGPHLTSLTSAIHKRELSEIVTRCVAQLPEIFRQLLEFDLDPDSPDDQTLADQLGISVHTVRSRRHRAHQLVRPLIEEALLTPDPSTPSKTPPA